MLSHADLLDTRLGELSPPNSGLQLHCKLEYFSVFKLYFNAKLISQSVLILPAMCVNYQTN